MPVIDFVIADDHELIREAIRSRIEKHGQWQIVGEAVNGVEAVRLCREHAPDIAIIDISMPDLNGIDAITRIRKFCPKIKILVLSMMNSDEVIQQALSSGAAGYLLKSDATAKLEEAVNSLLKGENFFSDAVHSPILSNVFDQENDAGKRFAAARTLSHREREILQLLAEGNRNREIAKKLSLSVHTVDAHRANIMIKLNLRNIADLVRYAIRNHIIES